MWHLPYPVWNILLLKAKVKEGAEMDAKGREHLIDLELDGTKTYEELSPVSSGWGGVRWRVLWTRWWAALLEGDFLMQLSGLFTREGVRFVKLENTPFLSADLLV
jgi:hypothetical protein